MQRRNFEEPVKKGGGWCANSSSGTQVRGSQKGLKRVGAYFRNFINMCCDNGTENVVYIQKFEGLKEYLI